MFDYKDKVAVITGGASGIGKACAELMAACGASVVVADFNRKAGAEVVSQLGGRGLFIGVDVTDASAVESLFVETAAEFGQLDCLVNSAGISAPLAPVADYDLADWHRVMDINLNGTFYAMKYALPLLLESGGGAIVNLSSIYGSVANANGSAYAASKHGVMGLTRAAAQEYAAQGVRVNAVAPGVIDTPMVEKALQVEALATVLKAQTPVGRFGLADEVAQLIAFLCSDAGHYINGVYYPIDGGFLAH